MEDRVRRCSVENDELHKKIELLETQNKTLAGQLRRLHQIIVNGGLRQTQTSTAMMVLLLSTALFLIPGFKESQGTANGGGPNGSRSDGNIRNKANGEISAGSGQVGNGFRHLPDSSAGLSQVGKLFRITFPI